MVGDVCGGGSIIIGRRQLKIKQLRFCFWVEKESRGERFWSEAKGQHAHTIRPSLCFDIIFWPNDLGSFELKGKPGLV